MGFRPRGSGRAKSSMASAKLRAAERAVFHIKVRECTAHAKSHAQEQNKKSTTGNLSHDEHEVRMNEERMLAKGWCPYQVRHLSAKFDPATFAYLAGLERSSLRTTVHQRCQQSENCIAYNTDPTAYNTRHIKAGCTCALISVPYDSLLKVIRRGRVPLISIETNGTGSSERFYLKVQPRRGNSSYTAISHVWADGFGNPHVNGLPSCQIECLRQSLTALQQGSTCFWMDTLCIPVGTHERAYRLAQIDNMASIYKGAEYGLLLDAELLDTVYARDHTKDHGTTSLHPRGRQDLYALLACITWNTRSWTLQEGKLPRSLAVQFHNTIAVFGRTSTEDGEFTIREVAIPHSENRLDPLSDGPGSVIEGPAGPLTEGDASPICSEHTQPSASSDCDCADIVLEKTFFHTFFDWPSKINVSQRFALVWDELSGRSTTMPEDVPMIMTNMLNLTNKGLLDLQDASQMYQAILLSLEAIPLAIFFNFGPRQDTGRQHQNRWIPTRIGEPRLSRYPQSWAVRSGYLELDYTQEMRNEGILVYIRNSAVPLPAKEHLELSGASTTYYVRPGVDPDDKFDAGAFAAMCYLIESPSAKGSNDVLRGACFYIHHDEQTGKFRSELDRVHALWRKMWCCKGDFKKVECYSMTFYCPLRFEKSNEPLKNDDTMETLGVPNIPCKLQARYDPLPGFQALKVRTESGWSLLLGGIALIVLFTMHLAPILRLGGPGVGWSLLLLLVTVPIGSFIVNGEMFGGMAEEMEAWSHVRSFQVTRRGNKDMV